MNKTQTKKHAIHDSGPTTMELAHTVLRAKDEGRVRPWNLVTLMDITLGVLIAYTLDAADEPLPDYMTHAFDDDALFAVLPGDLTLSVPDASVLADQVLAALPFRGDVRVVRRERTGPLHPVHLAAIRLLTGTASGHPTGINALATRMYATWTETRQYSLYEHTFNNRGDGRVQPVAIYRQARTTLTGEHAGHDFDPYCCGIARMRSLTAPRVGTTVGGVQS